MENLKDILNQFKIEGKVVKVAPCGNGRINRTLKVTTNTINGKKEYILQRINTNLFSDPNSLMQNIDLVTKHIRTVAPQEQTLNIIETTLGNLYLSSNGECFRVYDYIPHSISIDNPQEYPSAFYECGKIFGKFQKELSTFDAKKLTETLPNFHNTFDRYNKFINAVKEDKFNRVKNCINEIDFCITMAEKQKLATTILDRINNGTLPLRVTHNDTKLNNVAFNEYTNKALAVLDLDTVMPGALCYDFGDAIRFGCNTESEESTDFDKIKFNADLFRLYTQGYLEVAKDFITETELESLVDGCLVMTYEVGMRFLTDYLEGDTYFGAKYEDNNLNRAKNQFTHLQNMLYNKNLMQEIVFNTINNCLEQEK